jgi:hypothetical protein
MNRILIAGLVYLLIGITSFSQSKTSLTGAASFKLDIAADEKYNGTGKISFNQIIVRDYRFDSTKLGYSKSRQIIFDSPSSQAFTSLLNSYYRNTFDTTADKTLVIILKSFWLQRGFYDINGNKKINNSDPVLDKEKDESGVCIVDFEIFSLTQNNYKALLKFAYEFELSSYKRNKLDGSFFVAFDSMVTKIQSMNVDDVLSRKKSFNWTDLHDNYIKRFDIPVLKNNTPQRGVFMSFDDFKKNKTVYPDFAVNKSKITAQVYTTKNKDQLLTEYWGFFDGTDYYIKMGYNFFRMIRQNNTFDLLGPKKITGNSTYLQDRNPYGTNSYTPPLFSSGVAEPRPLQLDMETGEVY